MQNKPITVFAEFADADTTPEELLTDALLTYLSRFLNPEPQNRT